MARDENHKPPRLMLAFFRCFCHPDCREDVEGDLLERFHKRCATGGVRNARWWFVWDVFLLFRPGMIVGMERDDQLKFFTMRTSDWIKLAFISIMSVMLIISPFLPGPSVKLVHLLSVAGQLTGVAGLLLVPVGVAWTFIEFRDIKKTIITDEKSHCYLALSAAGLVAAAFFLGMIFLPNPMPKQAAFFGLVLHLTGFTLGQRQIKRQEQKNESLRDHGARMILAISATATLTFMCIFGLLGVFATIGIAAGIAGSLLFFALLLWLIRKIGRLRDDKEEKFNPMPLYAFTIPVVAFITFMFIVKPLSNFSRDFAIEKSVALIASIEEHKNRTGQYPASLDEVYAHSASSMPQPSIMGIDDFRYNRINDHYSLSFSQWLDLGSLEVIVLYDKDNLRNNLPVELSKYNYQFDLCRVKTAFASYDTRYANWRYYLCD